MAHKDCGGKVVECELDRGTVQLRCMKCGKIWRTFSDLSEIEVIDLRRRKPSMLSIFYDFTGVHECKFHMRARAPNLVIDFLFNDRLRRVIKMLDFKMDRKYVGLDVGCSTGYFTQYLAQLINGIIIGIDVRRPALYSGKLGTCLRACYEKPRSRGILEFICCDINHLPFKKDSIDFVVCASVLEHINDLEGAIKGIKHLMKKNGILVVGYPIETNLIMVLMRLFLPSGLSIRDPQILGKEKFERIPETHKQSYKTIRRLLQKQFLMVQREKSLISMLPDMISWYECVKMKKVK